ncbi:uncharacterized protein RCO7_11243 [Rhynchosporium graminicola]|uniref:2EXR domain-containing protein n=1 Tax=Rhynchosporium graminicola TaxID=2792576 RepID=A0A1E1LB63_9HELO|nr:uncharacterized protein RCO7_11243 [Rhynchosporium commune]
MLLLPARPLSPAYQRLLKIPTPHPRACRGDNEYTVQIHEAIEDEVLTFGCFPKLPPEVRVRIWTLALLPRVVTITSKFDRRAASCEVRVEASRIELLYVNHESRSEVLRYYSRIKFQGDYSGVTFVDWFRDTIFLDLPDEPGSADVDEVMNQLGTILRPVQKLAVRVRTHLFWGFPRFLRQAEDLQKLVFVDELDREPFPSSSKGCLYLIDLGSLGFIRGCKIGSYNESSYFSEDIWITLPEGHENDEFEEKRWEMSLETIAWVRRLTEIGERYCLLLPIT